MQVGDGELAGSEIHRTGLHKLESAAGPGAVLAEYIVHHKLVPGPNCR